MPPPARLFQVPHPSVTMNGSVAARPGLCRSTWNVADVPTFGGTYVVVPPAAEVCVGKLTSALIVVPAAAPDWM